MATKFIVSLYLFFFSSLISSSNGKGGKEYKTCSSPPSCGPTRDIQYPFSLPNNRFCGSGNPLFHLWCDNSTDYPHFLIGVKVHRIHTSSNTISVGLGLDDICEDIGKQPGKNYTNLIKHQLKNYFELGPNVGSVTLFFSCPNNFIPRFQNASFKCQTLGGTEFGYYLGKGGKVHSKCKSNVTIPVSKRAFDEFINSNGDKRTLEGVLKERVEVEYFDPNSTACNACRYSGGLCGSSIYSPFEFRCYRPVSDKHHLILAIGIAGVSLLAILLGAFYYCKKLRIGRVNFIPRGLSFIRATSDLEHGNLYIGVPLFSYKKLEEATDNFNASRELGSGGYGRVHYGKLKDGREVAVKQLHEKSYRTVEQFMNEVQILTRLRHQNLVSLYGCTSPRCRELLLVYEYISNGTVADHLYGEKAKSSFLSWDTRMKIAIETAQALSYLHSSDIIHRDVKTNNILLDDSFRVKVADFGLSRLFPTDVTHVSTAPQGTPGYLDPEYHQCYQLTAKSDVYSFGVVLIQLISSLLAVDKSRHGQEINLSNYAMKRIQLGAFEELVDPRLWFGSDYRVRKMTTSVAALAFQSLQHDKEVRPSMDEVLEILTSIKNDDYSEEPEVEDVEVRSHRKIMAASTSTYQEQDDDARLLTSSMNHHQQQTQPSSPNSVIHKWASRSTAASSSSRQGSELFYSISN